MEREEGFENRVVSVVKIRDGVSLPEYKTAQSAGFDFAATETIVLRPGQSYLMGTGLKIALPENVFLDIRPRSGLSLEYPNYIMNSPGTVDPDYRGEIKIALVNNTIRPWLIQAGDRIAQGVLVPFVRGWFVAAETLPETERGDGGYGSTGK